MNDALDATPMTLALTYGELCLVNNALNEVCNGIDIAEVEFHTRLGARREEARVLLSRLNLLLSEHRPDHIRTTC